MRISYSSLETYRSCPLKYKFQEIDKIKTPKSKEAVFGTLIHSTLKFIYTPGIISPSLEQALDHFSRNWNDEVFESEIEERAAFSQGVQMIQDFYQKNNPQEANIVDLESRFSYEIGFEEEKHIVSGIIDRIDKTKDGFEVIDYKTTKKMPSQEKVDNDLQLSVYLKAFLSRYPKEIENIDKIKVSLYYLKHGVKLSSTRTIQQLQESESLFLEIIQSINTGEFSPTPSPLCDWCGYQKMCPMWRHKFKEERKIDTEEANQLITEYVDLKRRMGLDKIKIAKLQEGILKYMDDEGVERVFSRDMIVARNIRKTYKYDESKLKTILEPLDSWENVLKIDGIALNKVMAQLPPSVRKKVEESKIPDKESKTLSIKKNKIEADD